MPHYPYVPKHDTSKVVPFGTNPNQATFTQFTQLVMKGKLNEVAYWFEQKELKNPKFKYFYDEPSKSAPSKSTYKMTDILGHVLETAISKGDKNMVEFLLFDPLVKDRHLFRTEKAALLTGGFDYGNSLLNDKNKPLVIFCIQQHVTGHPFYVEFPLPWLKEAFEGLPVSSPTLSYLKEIEKNYEKWHNPKTLAKEYPAEYQALLLTKKYITIHEQHKKLSKETGLVNEEEIKEEIQVIDKELLALSQKEKNLLDKIKKKRGELTQARKSLEEKLEAPSKHSSSKRVM